MKTKFINLTQSDDGPFWINVNHIMTFGHIHGVTALVISNGETIVVKQSVDDIVRFIQED